MTGGVVGDETKAEVAGSSVESRDTEMFELKSYRGINKRSSTVYHDEEYVN